MNQDIIKEFQQAIKKDYGKDVSFEEAMIMLKDLVEYFSTLKKIHCRIQSDELV